VHGLLHLAGFDDTTKRGYQRMKAAQEKIVFQIERALGRRKARPVRGKRIGRSGR
jgi:ssRNA-specific RNase YbeY (16S rRNA maturation enzyme)